MYKTHGIGQSIRTKALPLLLIWRLHFNYFCQFSVTGSSDSTTRAIHEILLEIFLPLLDEECVSDLLEKSGRHSLIVEARVFDLFRQGRLQRIPAVSDHKENQVIVAKLAR